jgi:hypothetical protein
VYIPEEEGIVLHSLWLQKVLSKLMYPKKIMKREGEERGEKEGGRERAAAKCILVSFAWYQRNTTQKERKNTVSSEEGRGRDLSSVPHYSVQIFYLKHEESTQSCNYNSHNGSTCCGRACKIVWIFINLARKQLPQEWI